MYPISNALKARFASNAKQYARITVGTTVITNSRIRLGSFSVNRYALAEDTVVFGSCVAAEFNVTLENGDGAYTTGTFLGEEAFVEVGCDVSGIVEYVPLGYFKFDMVTAQASALKLSALDRMMKFEQNVTTPYAISGTVSALIDTVCTACGVTRGTFTLPVNGTLTLSGELTDVKTYRDILRWIGEVTGTIAYIGYDGKLYFGWYSGTEDFTLDTSNRFQGSIADDATTITSVSIVQGEDMVTAGTGAKIVIRDNCLIPLASASAQAIANALYNHVNGFTYRSFEAGVTPLPHIAPLDCGTYTDADGDDYDICCTDWTFTLNATTKIAGKGGKQAYGRGYSLDESVFTARNIASGSVTAEKISVQDLAALRATIAGWKIGTDALYKDTLIGTTTYRVAMQAPTSPTASTSAVVVKKQEQGEATWTDVATIRYDGKVVSKDFEANGAVHIAPDYDLQQAGVYALDLENNNTNERLVANPDFLNIYGAGTTAHMDANHFTTSYDNGSASLTAENYGADYVEFRATQGTAGTYTYRKGTLSPKEATFEKNGASGSLWAHSKMTAEEVTVYLGTSDTNGVTVDGNAVTAKYDDNVASMWVNDSGAIISLDDYANGKSTVLTPTSFEVANHDLLRLAPHLAQMFATNIQANADLNTATYCEVGQYYIGSDVNAATLSNCPTGGLSFCMFVYAPNQTAYDDSTGYTRYRVRRILTYTGAQFIQRCVKNTSDVWSFGEWFRVVDSSTSLDSAVTWMKTQSGRLSSLDIGHSYNDDSRGRIRFDLSTGAQSGGANAVFGEGYVLTFMWDTTGRWDTQFYLPDADGNAPAFRTYRPNSGWNDVWRFQSEQVSTVTTDGVTWTVVRHYDGYVEMYADITLNGTWVAWGNLYVLSMSGNTKSLPVTLSKKLADVTTYITPESGVSANSAFPVQYYMTSENTYACDIARPSAGTNNKNYYCRKYIRGKI